MLIARRAPVYVRALPFLLGLVAFFIGAYLGPAWQWDWSLQTGNVFLTLAIPANLFVFDAQHLPFLVIGLVGLAVMVKPGLLGRAGAQRAAARGNTSGLSGAGRFYPLTFFFGLFATYYGVLFLSNASLGGDVTPGGPVIFLYLNYDAILQRPITSLLGAIVLAMGLFSLRSSLSFGLGDSSPGKDARGGQRGAQPEPSA